MKGNHEHRGAKPGRCMDPEMPVHPKRRSRTSAFSVLVSFIALALLGVSLLPYLPTKLYPTKDLPKIQVSAYLPGASPGYVEQHITSRIESALDRIRGVREIRSRSSMGSASIDLTLDEDADIEYTRFLVSSQLRRLWDELPQGTTFPDISVARSEQQSTLPFLVYSVNANLPLSDIETEVKAHLSSELKQIPGIRSVLLDGMVSTEVRYLYDPTQIANAGVAPGELYEALQSAIGKQRVGAVYAEMGQGMRDIVIKGDVDESALPDLRTTYVRSSKGDPIPLVRLLTVVRDESVPRNLFRINGLNSLLLQVYAEESANQIKLRDRVEEKIKLFSDQLSEGYEVHLLRDTSDKIEKELNTIYYRTGLTLVILLLFVLLTSGSMRYLFFIASSLVVNLLIVLTGYYLLGVEIHIYSLTGFTISLSLIIDNVIVMVDHIRHKGDKRAFFPMLAATLTTVGALSIIFFLDEETRLNLGDFSIVIILNLLGSLLTAALWVPALVEKVGFGAKRKIPRVTTRKTHHFPIYVGRVYQRYISVVYRYRGWLFGVTLLLFGLPLFLLPESLDQPGIVARVYNRVLGNEVYQKRLRPHLDKYLGGTLRLFAEEVYTGEYLSRQGDIELVVRAHTPTGSTQDHTDRIARQVEEFLTHKGRGIAQFQTQISGSQNMQIRILFTKEALRSHYPQTIYSELVNFVSHIGGAGWGVSGLPGTFYNNDPSQPEHGYSYITLLGYNYDKLTSIATELETRLSKHVRVSNTGIKAEYTPFEEDYSEYVLEPVPHFTLYSPTALRALYGSLSEAYSSGRYVGMVQTESKSMQLYFQSRDHADNVWNIQNKPLPDSSIKKAGALVKMEEHELPQDIIRANQRYQLLIRYKFAGTYRLNQSMASAECQQMQKDAPIGYSITPGTDEGKYGWSASKRGTPYILLIYIVIIMFFTTSVLFDSVGQPFAVICMIPISYIGVFLAFYLFGIRFDQGGYASMVLLAGITVNAALYIIHEYNVIRNSRPALSPLVAYSKAWQSKIIPIFLTTVSTMLGFVPFLLGSEKEAFWFPLAVGTISGLMMSLAGVFFVLPLLIVKKRQPKHKIYRV